MKEFLWIQFLVVTFLFDSKIGALLLFVTSIFFLLTGKDSFYSKLFHCITYTVPFYPFSFYGGRERLSLCTIYILLFSIYTILSNGRKLMVQKNQMFSIILSIVAIVGYSISMLLSLDTLQMFWDTYHSVVLLIALLACWSLRRTSTVFDTTKEFQTIIKGVCAIAGGLYIQFILCQFLNMEVGYIFISGGSRYIFNLYISAKSVLSMYLAVGLLYYYIQMLKWGKLKDVVILATLMGAMVINNSRTGLACFAIAAGFYTLLNFKKVLSKFRNVGLLILILCAGLYMVDYFMSTRLALGGVLDDNGRLDIIPQVLSAVPQNLLGIGGAVVDYNNVGITTVPHSFLFQVLLQHGVLGGICMYIAILNSVFSIKREFRYYSVLLICGSFLFAHWQNAVFIIPIFMIGELSNNNDF